MAAIIIGIPFVALVCAYLYMIWKDGRPRPRIVEKAEENRQKYIYFGEVVIDVEKE